MIWLSKKGLRERGKVVDIWDGRRDAWEKEGATLLLEALGGESYLPPLSFWALLTPVSAPKFTWPLPSSFLF